jgi:hypothetical protein
MELEMDCMVTIEEGRDLDMISEGEIFHLISRAEIHHSWISGVETYILGIFGIGKDHLWIIGVEMVLLWTIEVGRPLI